MKRQLQNLLLPVLAAGMGLFALVLRLCQSLIGVDEKGLLIPFHPFALLLWLLTAVAAVLTVLQVRTLDGSRRYAGNFAPSMSAALGCFAMAAGILFTLLLGPDAAMRLELVRNLVGFLSIPSLIWVGICRKKGSRPFFGFHAIVCVYLMLHTITRYQSWSSQPQLLIFLFPMMGCVLLTLFSYYQAAFDVGMGQRRMQLGTGLLGAYFCFAALAGGQDLPLYAAGGIWMLTNLCSLTPPRRRKAPVPAEEQA